MQLNSSLIDSTIFPDPVKYLHIPFQVIGKFSIRIVPDQTPAEIEKLVVAHCKEVHKKTGSPNDIKISMAHGCQPWMSDPSHPHYIAGRNATKLGKKFVYFQEYNVPLLSKVLLPFNTGRTP